jgi:bacteriocin-like protein
MDTRKVETRALSDDELNAVSGGFFAQFVQQFQAQEGKKEGDAIKGFQQMLKELP